MSDHYHDPADVKRLKDMRTLAPADYEAWVNLNRIVARTDGAIPRKYREIIAVAVAVAIQCPFCMEAHAKAAKAAGATREEIVEATFVASALSDKDITPADRERAEARAEHRLADIVADHVKAAWCDLKQLAVEAFAALDHDHVIRADRAQSLRL